MVAQPKISVIVPVYKAEAYLHRCVESLLAQSFYDFEVLLIDDGSPDRSGVICDEYARQDARIRAFHKENGGVSSARQYGMDRALGEYTIHADPDDWVEPAMLEALYDNAKATDADMVICDYYVDYEKRRKYITERPTSLDSRTVLSELFQHLSNSCCNKLVRRTCFERFGVRFPIGMDLGEDFYVNASLLKHDIRIAYLPRAFYHYVQNINVNTLSRRKDKKQLEIVRQMHEANHRILSEPEYREALLRLEAMDVYNLLYNDILERRELKALFPDTQNAVGNDFKIRCVRLAFRYYPAACLVMRGRRMMASLYHKLRNY